jgi:alanine dehydrogenase
VVHYAVANMPGAVPRTSTFALTNATISYALELANKGLEKALLESSALALGVNTYRGHVTFAAVAEAVGMPFTDLQALLHNEANSEGLNSPS